MSRRDAFSELRGSANQEEYRAEPNENSGKQAPARQPLDLIPTANPRKKRSRNWEKAHRSETVTYRGIPPEIQEMVVRIAEGLSVPRDEVVRAFLEYSIALFHGGRLDLIAYPKSQRMTLFPKPESTPSPHTVQKNSNEGWLSEVFPPSSTVERETRKRKRKDSPVNLSRWELRVTYRIPLKLKEEIRSIADEHTLPVGEVVWFFIEQALQAFRDGTLSLRPTPKLVGKTLFHA